MKQYVLLVFNMNWLDEFNCFGLRIHEKEYWEKLEKAINSNKDYLPYWYFGTNQGFEEATFEDLLDNIKVIPIDEGQKVALDLLKIHKKWGNGQFPAFEDLFHDMSLENPAEITPEIKAIIESTDD